MAVNQKISLPQVCETLGQDSWITREKTSARSSTSYSNNFCFMQAERRPISSSIVHGCARHLRTSRASQCKQSKHSALTICLGYALVDSQDSKFSTLCTAGPDRRAESSILNLRNQCQDISMSSSEYNRRTNLQYHASFKDAVAFLARNPIDDP